MECNRSDSSHPTCICDFRPYNGPLGNQCTIHGNHGTNIHGNHGKYNIPINDLNGEWYSDSDSVSVTRAPDQDYSRRSRPLRRWVYVTRLTLIYPVLSISIHLLLSVLASSIRLTLFIISNQLSPWLKWIALSVLYQQDILLLRTPAVPYN